MSNVLSEEKKQQVIAPGRLGWPLRRIEQAAGVRRETARRTHAAYHFTDGFLQDLQGEMAACRSCRHSLRIAPVVMLHDQDEKRRFEAVFSDVMVPSRS